MKDIPRTRWESQQPTLGHKLTTMTKNQRCEVQTAIMSPNI